MSLSRQTLSYRNCFIKQLSKADWSSGERSFGSCGHCAGGDRPKNAEKEFPHVTSMPRGCYEPWGVFRKPLLPNMKVSDCLRQFETGGLRRYTEDLPFEDVIVERAHPAT